MIKRILILEDDLETLSLLTGAINQLEQRLLVEKKKTELAVTVLSEYTQVQDYINRLDPNYFDLILLDRDCKACGSFHILDIEKFGPEKIISISSVPEYNLDAQRRGVTKVVLKEYTNLIPFVKQVIEMLVVKL